MTYTVKRGDTLTAIAKKYDITVEALVASNGIQDPHRIDAGQKLFIPGQDSKLRDAFRACLAMIEESNEYRTLSGLLEED